MGWNPTHRLDDEDWNEMRKKGVDVKFRELLTQARHTSYLIEKNPEIISKPLSEINQKQLK